LLYSFFWVIPPASQFYVPTFWKPMFPGSVPKRRNKIQTPGNYPKERIQHSQYGESWKSRTTNFYLYYLGGSVGRNYSFVRAGLLSNISLSSYWFLFK